MVHGALPKLLAVLVELRQQNKAKSIEPDALSRQQMDPFGRQ